MKILLIGNPNVGKTSLFNALTGANGRTGNYHGVTVEPAESTTIDGLDVVCDLPGIYDLNGSTVEERSADEYIQKAKRSYLLNEGDVLFVQVLAAPYLERGLRLTRALLRMNVPLVLAVTMCDKFRKRGGKIDCKRLGEALSLSCLEVNALKKWSVEEFLHSLRALNRKDVKWSGVYKKELLQEAYAKGSAGRFSERLLRPSFALPIFFLFVIAVFLFTFASGMPGAVMKTFIEGKTALFRRFCAEKITLPVLRTAVDCVVGGIGGVLAFLPQIACIYAALICLEESGMLSVLSYATDGFFSLFSMTGKSVFSILLGYGCVTAAIFSTRTLEDKRAQARTVGCLFFLPCSAKFPVYLTVLSALFDNAFWGAVLLYALGTLVGLFAAILFYRGEEEFVAEIADISFPNVFFALNKLRFLLKQFIIKVGVSVFLFSLAIGVLSSLSWRGVCGVEESILADICRWITPMFYPMGIKDWRLAFAAVSGFLAKENTVAILQTFFPEGVPLTLEGAFPYLVLLALLPPCVSALSACAAELGKKRSARYALAQTVAAFLGAYAVYCIMRFGWGAWCVAACLVAALGGLFWKSARKKRKNERRKT